MSKLRATSSGSGAGTRSTPTWNSACPPTPATTAPAPRSLTDLGVRRAPDDQQPGQERRPRPRTGSRSPAMSRCPSGRRAQPPLPAHQAGPDGARPAPAGHDPPCPPAATSGQGTRGDT
ncbi:hypothetical protein LV779_11710 [Streptomyces thinghirensis]|nr:hypothetical protein [Streptomyces thinghirensis]